MGRLLGVRRHATPARLPRRGPRLSAVWPTVSDLELLKLDSCQTKRRQAAAGQSAAGPAHSKETPRSLERVSVKNSQ